MCVVLSIIAMLGCKRESAKDKPKPGTTSAVIDSLLAGVPGVYRLDLTTAGGNPMMTIAEPSPNSD